MSYRLQILPSALREIAALPRRERERVDARIQALPANPRPPGLKARKGWLGLLRVRVGRYRVVFAVDDAARVVRVTRVGARGDVYRRL